MANLKIKNNVSYSEISYGANTAIVVNETGEVSIPSLDLKSDLASTDAGKGAALVGFKQSGTGAVVRTVEDKAREWVSVKDFGAVGDGVTDDTAAIQAAVNNTEFVFIPPGEYLLSSEIIFQDKGMTLFGGGMSVSVLKWTSLSASSGLVFENTNSKDKTTIYGLTLLTQKKGKDSAIKCVRSGESISGSVQNRTDVRVTIRDVEIKGATSTIVDGWLHGVEFTDVMHAVLSGVHVTGYNAGTPANPVTVDCFSISGTNNPAEIVISDCWGFSAINAVGISGAVEGVHIINCNFVNVNFGITWASATNDPLLSLVGSHINAHLVNVKLNGVNQAIINGNLFYKRADSVSNGSGVSLQNCIYPVVYGNTFVNQSALLYDCIVCQSGTVGALVHGNIFRSGTTGIWFQSGSSNCEQIANKKIDLTNRLFLDHGASNVKPNGSYVHLSNTSSRAIPTASQTILSWDNEDVDDISGFDISTDNTKIIIPEGVSYIDIHASVYWVDNSTGQRRIEIFKNGSSGISKDIRTPIANSAQSVSAMMLPVIAGDYFQIRVFQSSGGNLDVLPDSSTYFKVRVSKRDR